MTEDDLNANERLNKVQNSSCVTMAGETSITVKPNLQNKADFCPVTFSTEKFKSEDQRITEEKTTGFQDRRFGKPPLESCPPSFRKEIMTSQKTKNKEFEDEGGSLPKPKFTNLQPIQDDKNCIIDTHMKPQNNGVNDCSTQQDLIGLLNEFQTGFENCMKMVDMSAPHNSPVTDLGPPANKISVELRVDEATVNRKRKLMSEESENSQPPFLSLNRPCKLAKFDPWPESKDTTVGKTSGNIKSIISVPDDAKLGGTTSGDIIKPTSPASPRDVRPPVNVPGEESSSDLSQPPSIPGSISSGDTNKLTVQYDYNDPENKSVPSRSSTTHLNKEFPVVLSGIQKTSRNLAASSLDLGLDAPNVWRPKVETTQLYRAPMTNSNHSNKSSLTNSDHKIWSQFKSPMPGRELDPLKSKMSSMDNSFDTPKLSRSLTIISSEFSPPFAHNSELNRSFTINQEKTGNGFQSKEETLGLSHDDIQHSPPKLKRSLTVIPASFLSPILKPPMLKTSGHEFSKRE